EGVYLYRCNQADDGDVIVETISKPAEYKRVTKAYESLG
ncbi:MAG: DUF1292 domain-containing protein, partial [Clostridia bacterium]|nr:DUF1292 domain-containing protein [Clostridia bacterium]